MRQSARSRRSILHSLASSRNLRRSVTLSGGERSMKRTPGRRREGERAGESLKPPSDRRRLRRRRDSLCSLSLVSRCCRQQLLLLSSSISGAPVSDTERRLLVFLPRAWRLAAREGETEKGGEEQRKVISERHRLFFFCFRRRFSFSPSSDFFNFVLSEPSFEREERRALSLSLSPHVLSVSLSLSRGRERNGEGDTNHAASPVRAGPLVERSCCCCKDRSSSSGNRL